MALHFELVTPERVVFRQEVDQVSLPTTEGEITVLKNHIPLVANLVPGIAHLKIGDRDEEVAVSGGFIQIADNRIRVLADTAERGEELDLKSIEEAKKRAEKVMSETSRQDDNAFAMAAAALERELARYRVARRHHYRKGLPVSETPNLPHDENPA